MRLRRPWMSGLGIASALLALSARGSADPFRYHLQGGAARAVAGDQVHETGWGVYGGGAIELLLAPALGLELELSHVGLSAGDPPKDPGIAPRGASSAQAALLGVRVHPFATRRAPSSWFEASGLWLDAAGGMAKTGSLGRAVFDVDLGWDATFNGYGFGPFVGYEQVFQKKGALRPDDAQILVLGVHATLGGKVPPEAPKKVRGDRDHDGIFDDEDLCPDEPEDKDGFEDEDGCPDPDNDRDGILDGVDACPNEPGPATNNPKTHGCPVRDRDHDGIPDDADKCPDEPEDKDGFEDEDGCPDPDNDKDGIPDVSDQCPNEPETFNGYADEDGCPDEAQVRVVGDKILLDDRVHFQTNRAVVLADSQPLLWRVALLINKHPEYTHIEVAGYADERGPDSYNQPLSEARAKAVETVLIRYGVVRSRLSSVGYGTANPRLAESNEHAWKENRRTEFTITRESKQTTYTDFPGANVVDHSAPPVPAASGVPAPPPVPPVPAASGVPAPPPVPSAGAGESGSRAPKKGASE